MNRSWFAQTAMPTSLPSAPTVRCAACGKECFDNLNRCPNCHAEPLISVPLDRERAIESERALAKLRGIILTTEAYCPDLEIAERLGVITAECCFGMNIFRDLFASARDLAGGRSVATQKVLRDARETCLTELRREAFELGADAVVAIDLDYSEFSGGKLGGMLFLVASGTAVKLASRPGRGSEQR